jgi:hypothetical protein
MKRLCALMVTAAALITSIFIPAARAETTGPLAGLEAICLKEGGTWYPFEYEFVGKVVCFDPDFIVPSRTQLTNIERLCQAAGYSGVRTFGKGIPVGILVETWACV